MKCIHTFLLTALCLAQGLTGTVLGASPIGAPRAVVGEKKWTLGASLGYQETNMKATGSYQEVVTGAPDTTNRIETEFDVDKLKSAMIFGQINYGVFDQWDIYLVLGGSNAQSDVKNNSNTRGSTTTYIGAGEQFDVDSSLGFAWGLGTRVTFAENADVSWGAVGQVTWYDPASSGSTWNNPGASNESLNADIDMQYMELLIATGPTFNLDSWWIYGGPFLYLVDGDMDISGSYRDTSFGAPFNTGPISGSLDVEQKSEIGLYVGSQWLMSENSHLYSDIQFTGDSWGIGLGGLWRLE
jgi:hypothetical protein